MGAFTVVMLSTTSMTTIIIILNVTIMDMTHFAFARMNFAIIAGMIIYTDTICIPVI